ncbi:MAG: hypothetical protein HYR72_24175 [Deltaproteobacteria bacterium]|nr:hypothetical protein [Deltaproteobacteria bacterium]MBI3389199.1 hypothetical protein [Deltaproteobacteria bacterium]
MSYCSSNSLEPGTKVNDVIEFVRLLRYRPEGSLSSEEVGRLRCFHWFDEADYRSWSGIELSIHETQGTVQVETRTPIGRSYYDLSHQNDTIRLLRKHFGGSFVTDEGRGRYQRPGSGPPSPAASGCHLAFQRFGANLITCHVYFRDREFKSPKRKRPTGVYVMDFTNPWLISNNLLLPYLVAITEDYWKSTFIPLLRYSSKKEAILRSGRLTAEHLAAVSDGRRSVEEALVEALPFQRVSAACRHFSALDPNLDFAGVLRKPYRRRRQSLFESLEQMTEIRHELVHRARLSEVLTDEFVASLLHNLQVAVVRCYRHLTKRNGWAFEKWWAVGGL